MTRSWSFTLKPILNNGVVSPTWYNLWTLITGDSSFTDPYFGNAPFVPNMVEELEIQNQTPGATLQRSDDSELEAGLRVTGNAADLRRAVKSNIDLKRVNLLTDTNPTVVYVGITA